MELSKRLNAVAGLVTEGASVADIGTDHGYVPIYLAGTGKCPHVIAMDINRGPLERAMEHIRAHELESRIETRLSDGLKSLKKGEADTMIAAGMGGNLTIRILDNSPELVEGMEEFILQPQSEIHKVRKYLNQNGFLLVAEDMVEEDGKFYPVMKLIHGNEPAFSEEELYYGRILLAEKHPVLHKFLIREKKRKEMICGKLSAQPGERALLRRGELEKEISRIRRGLAAYDKA
ncbi:MAG: class I SAM-dependent methyltransferase [Eubacteriales bacterium]|nr:class I SAM-dependent methyltransferase [Eubacteriales bacterium]